MNHYQLILPATPSLSDLRALSLLVLFGEEVTVQRSAIEVSSDTTTISPETVTYQSLEAGTDATALTVSALVPFAITNLSTPNLIQTVYSSETQQTFESFDKPIVEAGDLVVALATTAKEESEVGANYDDFVKINHSSPIFIGVANSSKSQFNTPFEGLPFVVIGKRNFDRMTDSIMANSASLKKQIALISGITKKMFSKPSEYAKPNNNITKSNYINKKR
jgi:hypothetical protein